MNIIKECFNSYGMEYVDAIGLNGTNKQKIWSGDSIEYIKAFNTYIFYNSYLRRPSDCRGTLDELIKMYNEDKEYLEDEIHKNYIKHFGSIKAGLFDFDTLLKKLYACEDNLKIVEPKAKSRKHYNYCKNIIQSCISLIENAYEVS